MIHHNEFVKSTCSKQFFKEVGYELVFVLGNGQNYENQNVENQKELRK